MAIKNYEDRKEGKVKAKPEEKEELTLGHGGETCYCPYCDAEVPEGEKVCKTCETPVEDHR
jgi:nitrogen fixation NifU-like protein